MVYDVNMTNYDAGLPEHLSVKEAVPGPGTYSADPDALRHSGPLVQPGLYANAKWAVDTTVRTNLGLPKHTHKMPPGPGLYFRTHSANNLTGSKQLKSSWRNSAESGWQDYCARQCQTPVVLSREHERERYGTHSPGPMTAVPVDAVGRQLTSNRKTQPRVGSVRLGEEGTHGASLSAFICLELPLLGYSSCVHTLLEVMIRYNSSAGDELPPCHAASVVVETAAKVSSVAS
ncbi:hypothetical protein VOLCADRAFT_93864 [Volvox carteri f. nagariensis]|uniref:Flagellar associated protein n=1 Tax=Volvox carteri f. nagariensis TaxID=3068 RepID=D8U395_VOLCA|nr:uncharacterized protein VOLCADRAFT_93864 [Volvox carteri f. nagariensis]EFJ45788.1 hypothetical protein VOLCADRAFT_93864 [Volvox carteri f. nagariensis]|eukprot:XP_002953189.1 hypothetical protein VOLCADRAFT_93864 [Volvox carteri f. nagariensis]